MSEISSALEQLRQQYNEAPYPRVPLEQSYGDDLDALYLHSFVTPYYLVNRRPPDGQLTILDAGCGSGLTTLALAQANPGASIVAIDISEQSVAIARERLAHHGFSEVEFHAMPLEALPELGRVFDYINCDEVLYILPDPVVGLRALRAVLATQGILRANLHSAIARAAVFRAQQVFKIMGVLGSAPAGLAEIALVRGMMDALNHNTHLKTETWIPCIHLHDDIEWYQMNYLLPADKGYTVPELFEMLAAADLGFISMLLWPTWEVKYLFQDPQHLPPLFGSLERTGPLERLHLYELIHGCHRLIDFWCGSAGSASLSPDDWTPIDFEQAIFRLHPRLQHPRLKAALTEAKETEPFHLQQHIRYPFGEALPPVAAGCLLALWDGPCSFAQLVQSGLGSDCADIEGVADNLRRFLSEAERLVYVLVE